MELYVACEYRCPVCKGIIDCSDLGSNNARDYL